MQLRHSIRPAQVHVVEVLGRLLRYELLHRYDELLALEALREQVVHGHEYLTMLRRPLHLLGRDLLVHGHLATLFILQLLQFLLLSRDLVVELDLLGDVLLLDVHNALG